MALELKGKNSNKAKIKRLRTTVLIREDHIEKFKTLVWCENRTMKDIFDEMIDEYLSSKIHLDRLIEERANLKSNLVAPD